MVLLQVYDSHSVSVGNDSLGTLTVHGHGGSNAAAALDTTAAGDFWDNTLGIGQLRVVQHSSISCKWKWSSCLLSTFSG